MDHNEDSSNDEEGHSTWKRPRKGVEDSDQLERQRRQAVLNALEDNPNGLGFNELHNHVEDLFARNTLKHRLERYEERDLIELPEVRRGQKKQIRIIDAGTKPEQINKSYRNWQANILKIWDEALDMYTSGEFESREILKYVYDECLRYDLATRVIVSSGGGSYPEDVGDIAYQDVAIPIPESESPAQMYESIAGELQKFYTEKIFGTIFIHTEDKADQLISDVILEAYSTINLLRRKMLDKWDNSEVPHPSHS